MKTIIQKIDATNMASSDFKEAAELLRSGRLVAFPTETVYGLGGNAYDSTASARIYAAKGRPSDNPLIVHISLKSWLPWYPIYLMRQKLWLTDFGRVLLP